MFAGCLRAPLDSSACSQCRCLTRIPFGFSRLLSLRSLSLSLSRALSVPPIYTAGNQNGNSPEHFVLREIMAVRPSGVEGLPASVMPAGTIVNTGYQMQVRDPRVALGTCFRLGNVRLCLRALLSSSA